MFQDTIDEFQLWQNCSAVFLAQLNLQNHFQMRFMTKAITLLTDDAKP
jgi:hypothetical protein